MDSDFTEVPVLKNMVIFPAPCGLCYRTLSAFCHFIPVYVTSVYKTVGFFFFWRKSKKGDLLITICTKQFTSLLARLLQCLCLSNHV